MEAAERSPNKDEKTINIFRVPHSRMKELVDAHLRKLGDIQDLNSQRDTLESLLESVYEAMWELKSHEYIENHFIMDRLKARLQKRRVYNQTVCNCHEDSKLLTVIHLVEKVYDAKTPKDRTDIGKTLQGALKDFLGEFLHHMEEEESVFQPLLNENFEPRELQDMNEMVLRQHNLFRAKVKSEKSLKQAVKRRREEMEASNADGTSSGDEDFEAMEELRIRKTYCQEVKDFYGEDDQGSSSKVVQEMEQMRKKTKNGDENGGPSCSTKKARYDHLEENEESKWKLLPVEIVTKILEYLGPKDLLRMARVCRLWNEQALQPRLWRIITPVSWAKRDWSFRTSGLRIRNIENNNHQSHQQQPQQLPQPLPIKSTNDEDDSSKAQNGSSEAEENSSRDREAEVLNSVLEFLLPRVGSGVRYLNLSSYGSEFEPETVNAYLKSCPDLRVLDLAYTKIGDPSAFKGVVLKKLEVLILDGCNLAGDSLLEELSRGYNNRRRTGNLKQVSLSGCSRVTTSGLDALKSHQNTLENLDLSGLCHLRGEHLREFVKECTKLEPAGLAYCNDIEDGPFPKEANGCLNLDCMTRFCCQQLKN